MIVLLRLNHIKRFFPTHKINVLIESKENVHMALTNLYVGKAGDIGDVKCLGEKSI